MESVRAGKGRTLIWTSRLLILEVWKGLTTRAIVILHGKELP